MQASPIKFKRTYSNNVYEKKKDKLFEKEAHKNYYLRVKKIYRWWMLYPWFIERLIPPLCWNPDSGI